jgi:hypothetical protein
MQEINEEMKTALLLKKASFLAEIKIYTFRVS